MTCADLSSVRDPRVGPELPADDVWSGPPPGLAEVNLHCRNPWHIFGVVTKSLLLAPIFSLAGGCRHQCWSLGRHLLSYLTGSRIDSTSTTATTTWTNRCTLGEPHLTGCRPHSSSARTVRVVAEPDREVRLRPGARSRRSHGAFTHQTAELETHPRGHPTRNRSRPELLVTTPPHSVPADEPRMRNVTVRPAWRQGAGARPRRLVRS